MTAVLGISALYHDAAAALVVDGEVVAAASEERFSRVKHDSSLPVLAVRACLARAGLTMRDLDRVVFYEKPLRKYERILVSHVLTFPRSLPAFVRSQLSWLTDKLWLRDRLCTALGARPSQIAFCEHHLAHAASAFYGTDLPEAAVLVVDGVGEWATTSLYRGGEGGLQRLGEVRFPHSLGLLYSAFTAWAGFEVNEGEYKLMGLAAYGEPTRADDVRKLIRLDDDGGFELDLSYVAWHHSSHRSTTARFDALFGPPRHPGAPLDPTTPEGKRIADVAASIQVVLEEALLGLARGLHARTGLPDLCYAGGVALNGVANHRLLTEGPFRSLHVHPAAGDAGAAVGAALWGWTEVLGQPRPAADLKPGLGTEVHRDAVRALLDDLNQRYVELEDPAPRVAEDLAAGRVVGWHEGRFEWGPRALGHRSILADPSVPDIRDRINAKVKFREPFRPFAPAARAEEAARLCHLPPGGEQPARWMVMVAPVQEGVADRLPSTTHVDGTARIQVVDDALVPAFGRVVDAFTTLTGTPAVLNTSFNLRGEPIVSTPLESLATFHRSGLDACYIQGFRVEPKA
ncbi:MAG: carbamoyl transferase [Alphaproteobacteria bacterium]|nr:carbamoyl transferase [Alphaproteobacteria bacterium]